MITKALMLLLGLAGSPAATLDGVSEAVADFLDMMIKEDPERAGSEAEILINMYEGNKHLRDENILQCLKKTQRCWENALSDASTQPLCVATAQTCRTLVLTMTKPTSSPQIEVRPPRELILYKTLDLCGESFDVSQLHEAAQTDAHLALAIRHMQQKGVKFSSYCFVDFYAETGSRTLSFDPGRFERGTFAGSPSPDIPSYQVAIDEATGQVTLGHYQK
jgi:hypothetical protein